MILIKPREKGVCRLEKMRNAYAEADNPRQINIKSSQNKKIRK